MYDDPPADLPSGLSTDPDDRVAPASTEFARSQLPLGDHATTERVCPFLRAVAEDGTLGPPIETPDPANRCVAMDEPVPQSLRQQELVCLSSAHVNCPRYLRGSVGLVAPVERVAPTRTVTPATAARIGAVRARLRGVDRVRRRHRRPGADRGGPTSSPDGAVLGEIETAAPVAELTADPTVAPTPAPTPTPSPSPTASPSPSPSLDAVPDAEPDARADSKADPEADVRPLRAADALPGHAELLHLRRALG